MCPQALTTHTILCRYLTLLNNRISEIFDFRLHFTRVTFYKKHISHLRTFRIVKPTLMRAHTYHWILVSNPPPPTRILGSFSYMTVCPCCKQRNHWIKGTPTLSVSFPFLSLAFSLLYFASWYWSNFGNLSIMTLRRAVGNEPKLMSLSFNVCN